MIIQDETVVIQAPTNIDMEIGRDYDGLEFDKK